MNEVRYFSDQEISDDRNLIEFLQSEYSTREFIDATSGYDSIATGREPTRALIGKLNSEQELHRGENNNIVLQLWKNLLGDAIIFLKSKDQREQLHDGEIFGVDSIYELLAAFKDFEAILYGASEYYRDHVTHVLRVLLLGDMVIQKSFGYASVDIGSKLFNKAVSPSEKECMWCIIALTHDLGYALENVDEINKRVGNMVKEHGRVTYQALSYAFPPQRHMIDEFMLKLVSSNLQKIDNDLKEEYVTHVQSKYFLKYARAYENYDHGLISCSILMRELVYFLETDFILDAHKYLDNEDARQYLIRQNMLRAIASHNCGNIYHLSITNFPCMLTLFDEMQEWGRPRLTDVFKRAMPITSLKINHFSDSQVDYTIKFECDKPDPSEKKELANNVIKYFIRKTERFIKIFRSAVGGRRDYDPRSIDLSFEVEDAIGNHSYKLRLPQPQDSETKLKPIIYKDGKEVKLQDLRDRAYNQQDLQGTTGQSLHSNHIQTATESVE